MKASFLKIAALAIFSVLGLGALIASPTFATATICEQCGKAGGPPDTVCAANLCPGYENTNSLENVIVVILNAVIGALGLVAVIFIIIGGINYMTSAGDASKVEKGKKTILYALIGLVICAISFAIVNWVIAGVLGNS